MDLHKFLTIKNAFKNTKPSKPNKKKATN
jgi:hypothetical protein